MKSTQKKSMNEKRSSSPESYYDTFESPIGTLYLIFTGKFLGEIDFKKPVDVARKGCVSHSIQKELREYFALGKDVFTQKIDLSTGTAFEREVWLALKEVPFGETRTYKWLADKVGKPKASRAVGRALGKNPLPIVLPCHRIIESDGSLGGYSGGVDIKRRLLEMEYYVRLGKKAG